MTIRCWPRSSTRWAARVATASRPTPRPCTAGSTNTSIDAWRYIGSSSSPYCTIPRTTPSKRIAKRTADESSYGQASDAASSPQRALTWGVARICRRSATCDGVTGTRVVRAPTRSTGRSSPPSRAVVTDSFSAQVARDLAVPLPGGERLAVAPALQRDVEVVRRRAGHQRHVGAGPDGRLRPPHGEVGSRLRPLLPRHRVDRHRTGVALADRPAVHLVVAAVRVGARRPSAQHVARDLPVHVRRLDLGRGDQRQA